MSFFNELKRRNVLRVAAAYAVTAWLLIQVSETIIPLFGFDDAPTRIAVIVLAIAFVPVLIFAWAYEFTPEGLKKDSDIDRTRSIAPNASKKLDRLIMIGLALALGYFAFDKFVLDPMRDIEIAATASQEGRSTALVESYGEKSIAVLAFEDMSQSKDQEYLSDGIAEELLNLLAGIPELRVISRSSAFSYKDKDIKLAQVAEELDVANILEGSVRKTGNRVRITVQLIEARTDTHLWSQTYDRTLDDIFAIQDEIAAAVVEQLKITLLDAVPKEKETNPEAYALHLHARYSYRRMSAEGFELCVDLNQQALAIDPGYVTAWDGLARCYISMANHGALPADEGYALAREALEKALLIEPDYAGAHSTLGYIAMSYDGDLTAAARHYMQALAKEPANQNNIASAAILMQYFGRWEQAIELHQYQLDRAPLAPVAYINQGLSYLSAGRWDEAIATTKTALRLSPGFTFGPITISRALLLKGKPEAALANLPLDLGTLEWARKELQIMAYHALGQTEASDELLAEFITEHEHDDGAVKIAYLLAYREDADRAFEWLDKAIEYGDPYLARVHLLPFFANIYDDPRWLPFLESIGRSPTQLDAINFEVTIQNVLE